MTAHAADRCSQRRPHFGVPRSILFRLALAATLTGGIINAPLMSVHAQTIGPDEAVTADGAVTQTLALTEAQKNAIYNAVLSQRVRVATPTIHPVVGAPVPPSLSLPDLPVETLLDSDSLGDSRGNLLKYAIVEDEVVLVDPLQMRVVGVVHGGAIAGVKQ